MGWANHVMERPRSCRKRAIREVARRAEPQESMREIAAMNTAPREGLSVKGGREGEGVRGEEVRGEGVRGEEVRGEGVRGEGVRCEEGGSEG